MSNIVELKAPRARDIAADADQVPARADLCADAGGPTMLDLTVAVHRAVKGSEWNVRFYRGQATGL